MLSQDKCLPIAYKCLHFTVLFVLEKYCGFKMCLSTVWKPSALAWPTHSLTRGSQKCLLQLRPTSVRAGTHTTHAHGSPLPPCSWPEVGRQCCENRGVEASLQGVPVNTDTCSLSRLPTRTVSLSAPGPVVLGGHCFSPQGVTPVKPPQATEEPGGHSKPEAEELNLSEPRHHFRN